MCAETSPVLIWRQNIVARREPRRPVAHKAGCTGTEERTDEVIDKSTDFG
jgi:hypothetical protein